MFHRFFLTCQVRNQYQLQLTSILKFYDCSIKVSPFTGACGGLSLPYIDYMFITFL